MADPNAAAERYLDRLELMEPDSVLRRRIDDVRADLRGDHGPSGVECITAELIACSLGSRHRPELADPT